MRPALPIVTDDTDLAVELARLGERLGIAVAPRFSASPWADGDPLAGLLVLQPPSPEQLLEAARRTAGRLVVGCIGLGDGDVEGLGQDLGIPVLSESRAFLAALALRDAGEGAAASTVRALPRAARARFERAGWSGERGRGRLVMLDDVIVGWEGPDGAAALPLGEPSDVAEAGAALRRAELGSLPGRGTVEGVDRERVREVLFGPSRALSDPASKSALAPYGVPLPVEELCTSPSRAAAEAARIGFPVKLSLASPDLRVWDHPDLVVLGAANAAAVRDGFRTIVTVAAERDPGARLLGVHVTAEAAATTYLRLTLRPMGESWALAELGRTDEAVAPTQLVLPSSFERCRNALARIGVTPPRSRSSVDALVDALNRLAVFTSDHRDCVTSVRVDPLAMLVGGGVEVREVCVAVNDLFERSLAHDSVR
ncbi:MAG: hypothetical protein OHK0013_38850 [Sandaracinaceae bacterium]